MKRVKATLGIFNDMFGTCGQSQDQEFKIISGNYKDSFPEIQFKIIHLKNPQDLLSKRCDIMVLDYGGMVARGACGFRDTVNSIHRLVSRLIDDSPSTLFIFWSDMAVDDYADCMAKELDELGANVFIDEVFKDKSHKKWIMRVKVHLGVV